MPIIRSWALTRGFALHPGTRNRYEIRYTRTQHRPPSRQVNDHGRVSGTHRVNWFNRRRLHHHNSGRVPPAEAEDLHYRQQHSAHQGETDNKQPA